MTEVSKEPKEEANAKVGLLQFHSILMRVK